MKEDEKDYAIACAVPADAEGVLLMLNDPGDQPRSRHADGQHQKSEVVPSTSPSMDIQVSSNFERLIFDLYDREGDAVAQVMGDLQSGGGFRLSQGALQRMRDEFDSGRASEAEVATQIKETAAATGQILCPHTCAGLVTAAAQPAGNPVPMVALATAHAAKFPDAVEAACGTRPALPPHMADIFDRDERITRVANDLGALEGVVRAGIAGRQS